MNHNTVFKCCPLKLMKSRLLSWCQGRGNCSRGTTWWYSCRLSLVNGCLWIYVVYSSLRMRHTCKIGLSRILIVCCCLSWNICSYVRIIRLVTSWENASALLTSRWSIIIINNRISTYSLTEIWTSNVGIVSMDRVCNRSSTQMMIATCVDAIMLMSTSELSVTLIGSTISHCRHFKQRVHLNIN